MKKTKVMIVDDDKELLAELEEALSPEPYDVIIVNDLSTVLKAAVKAKDPRRKKKGGG